ncbi:hypothetical protein MLD38_007388 [Melastoma candidum]|uniref:Uncharacterized protein n=1 Tax=Melastoma candidum TaxID=119954 RepID=A0ACB9RU02_9MYRT|nr:hypothetical protein MLD38_007388 [Melastoma candidum]
MDMYAKTGNVVKATEAFKSMKSRSVATWTTMIAGLALHRKGREALKVISQMQRGNAAGEVSDEQDYFHCCATCLQP